MAKNMKFGPSKTRYLPVPNGFVSGQPCAVGNIVGVLQTTEGDTAAGMAEGFATVAIDGVTTQPVSTTTTGAVGASVYVITATGVLTMASNSGANPLFGTLLTAKGSTAGQSCDIEIHTS